MIDQNYIDLLAKHQINSAHPGGFTLTRELLSTLPIHESTVVLDVGCGTGETSVYLASLYNCKVSAIDINIKMLDSAYRRFSKESPEIRLMYADALQLPFLQDTFDLILSESVTVFTDIPKACKEYARVLKYGGILAAVEITAEGILNAKELNLVKAVYDIERVPTQDEWVHMLRVAGFGDIHVHKFMPGPEFHPLSAEMAMDFYPHMYTMYKLHDRLGYRIYLCRL